ncbi:MAG TPA: hypothetical protein VEK07_06890 [Polyangiaceae bacterium]|nr:hypothetical protein [Polyangiaceae bacterium]
MRTIAPWIAILAAVALTAPAVAAAEDPTVRDAQARFEEGLDRVKTGDYEAARISFAQAYALLKRPAILWNLALAEEKTGHLVEALTHFKRVARDALATNGDREDAQRHATALAAKTGHLDVQAPAGSSLRVDGESIEAVSPLEEPLDVSVGHHIVEARWAEGAKSASVDVAAGQVAHVSLGTKEAAGPSAPEGSVSQSSVGAAAPPGLSAGGAENEPPPAAHHETSVAHLVTTASIGGAAVAAVAVAIALGLESQSNANQAASDRTLLNQTVSAGNSNTGCYGGANTTLCPKLNDAVQAQNRDAKASDVLYATGGVLAVAAVAAWFLWPQSRTEPSAWLAPTVGTSEVGIRAGGRF